MIWCGLTRRTTILAVRRGGPSMCDYSLHNVASRPAKVGDKLVTTNFSNSSTRGFAAIGEPNVAVCLLPGTEVAFEREVECDHAFGRLLPSLRFGKLGEKVAPKGRSCWSPACAKVSTRPCCSCQLPRALQPKRRSKSAILSLPDRPACHQAYLSKAIEISHRGADTDYAQRHPQVDDED